MIQIKNCGNLAEKVICDTASLLNIYGGDKENEEI